MCIRDSELAERSRGDGTPPFGRDAPEPRFLHDEDEEAARELGTDSWSSLAVLREDTWGGALSEAGSVGALVRVVWGQKRLLLLLSGTAVAGVGAVTGLLIWAEVRVGGSLVLGVAGVLVLSFLATFFNSVLLVAAADALRGRPGGIGSSCARAVGRVRAIAAWAPIGAVVLLGV